MGVGGLERAHRVINLALAGKQKQLWVGGDGFDGNYI